MAMKGIITAPANDFYIAKKALGINNNTSTSNKAPSPEAQSLYANQIMNTVIPSIEYGKSNTNNTMAKKVEEAKNKVVNNINSQYAANSRKNTTPTTNAVTTRQSYDSTYNPNNSLSQLYSLYEQQLESQRQMQLELQNSLAAQLQAQQERYEAQLRAQQEAQKQAAQNAYNNNMSALEAAYTKRLAGLDDNLATTNNALASSYGNSRDSLNANSEKALQEAYVNRMMNERNLRQQMNAQGLNGGASESALASLYNTYGNSRNNINNATMDSLRSLEETYNNNIANARQNYNNAMSSAADSNMAYRMQLENDLANNTVSSYQDLYNALGSMDGTYANAMINLIASQNSANADLQNTLFDAMLDSAIAPYKVKVSSSGSGGGNSSNTIAAKVKRLYQNGVTPAEIINGELSGYTNEQIAQIFSSAGISI